MIFFVLSPIAFAQEATSSSSAISDVQPTTDNLLPITDFPASPTGSQPIPDYRLPITDYQYPTTIVTPLPFSDETQLDSTATIREKESIRALSRDTYLADEEIPVIIDNTLSDSTQVKLFDKDGLEVPVEYEVINNTDPTVYALRFPKQGKAGRFRLEVTSPDGQVRYEDFTWGVLAINPDKPVYQSGENADIAIAVLDEAGMMVCDADITLSIVKPDGSTDTLSTAENTISVNPECNNKAFTLVPDYQTQYTVGEQGTYKLTLSAITENGQYTVTDELAVDENVPFTIKRVSATRLYPPVTYPMGIEITARTDFSGTITEKVPAGIAVSPLENAISYDTLDVASPSAQSTETMYPVPQLRLPFDNTYPLTQMFGSQADDPALQDKYARYGVVGHDGVDFDTPIGTGVLAVDDGEVISVEQFGDYGQTIIIQHSWGRSYYGHLSLMTAYVGQKRDKGMPIALSGNSGLSTGPHLHLGIRPNESDENNGYYGKINPLPYLGLIQEENGTQYTTGFPSSSYAETVLTWNITLKKGETKLIGYSYMVPNISPQFYRLGPLSFTGSSQLTAVSVSGSDSEPITDYRLPITEASTPSSELSLEDLISTDSASNNSITEPITDYRLPITDESTPSASPDVSPSTDYRLPITDNHLSTIPESSPSSSVTQPISQFPNFPISTIYYTEPRTWQLAVDADGSGGGTVTPRHGIVGDTQQTYVFAYTASETMDSGAVTLTVPAGWTTPQGVNGSAGYTVGSTSGNATIGTVLSAVDSATGWTEDTTGDDCTTANVGTDATTKKEGTASIRCNNDGSNSQDDDDGIIYSFTSQNWTNYTDVAFWFYSDDGMTTTDMEFTVDSVADTCDATQVYGPVTFPVAPTADTWVYEKFTLSGTRTDVEALCFENQANSADSDSYYVDEILVGPAAVTFASSTVTARILDQASGENIIFTYGSGGGTSGVTNSATQGEHTFTMQSKTAVNGTLQNLSGSPVITLINANTDLMRHGKWFNSSGARQPFVF
jgi:murein DD-endopeptidase MepM/ murein hydrolase activator NlpD